MKKKSRKEEITEALNNISESEEKIILERMGIKDGKLDDIWKEIVDEINRTGKISVVLPPDDFFYNEEDLPDWMWLNYENFSFERI